MKKKFIFPICYAILLVGFTTYVLLDAFVIPRSYKLADKTSVSSNSGVIYGENNDNNNDESNASKENSTENKTITDTTYADGKTTIKITTYRQNDTNIYVADIILSSADQLKTAFAKDTYGKNITETTSAIAQNNNAILAINGDYYGVRNGYVLRNGTVYRDTQNSSSQEDLVLYKEGTMQTITEGNTTAQELSSNSVLQLLSFGPTLVKDRSIAVSQNDEVDKAMTSNPRTAIGYIDKLHYVMVVSDGRTNESTGLSLYELADFMKNKLNVKLAYNLDGGGSSTMYFNGNIVNKPTTNGNKISERKVSDIVYI